MKLKTALELLGHSAILCNELNCKWCTDEGALNELGLVARRAREEAYEIAAQEAMKQYAERRPVLEERKAIAERIRTLNAEAKS